MSCRVGVRVALQPHCLFLFSSLFWALAGLAAADSRDEAAARLGEGDRASEYWDVVADFDDGHRLFVRFGITNEGPGERTGHAVGHLAFPDGDVLPFHNGRRQARWTLSEDGLRMKIGSSVLDLRRPGSPLPGSLLPGSLLPGSLLEVDKNRLGVEIFLAFERRPGAPRRWASAPTGLALQLVALGVPVRGSIWVRDRMGDAPAIEVEGRLSITHTWMDEREPQLSSRRIEPHFFRSIPGASELHAYLVQVLPPGGAPRHWLVARRDGVWLETDRLKLTESGRHPASLDGYPVPARLEVAGADLRGRIALGRPLVDHDPLAAVPLPFRWLLSLRTAPRQLWLDAELELTWTAVAGSLEMSGPGLVSVTFTNPLGRETPSP